MKVIIADGKEKLNIGRQTDNERTTVIFPLTDLLEEFPGGAASLKIRRPHENEFYVSETTAMDGANLLWVVQDYDVAIEGDGEVQLYYTVDDVAAPGRIFKTHSDRSLTDQAAALPGWSSWKDDLIAAGNAILAAILSYNSMTAVATGLEPGDTPTAEIIDNVLHLGLVPGQDGQDGLDAPQIDDTQASPANPWSGQKTETELEKKEKLKEYELIADVTLEEDTDELLFDKFSDDTDLIITDFIMECEFKAVPTASYLGASWYDSNNRENLLPTGQMLTTENDMTCYYWNERRGNLVRGYANRPQYYDSTTYQAPYYYNVLYESPTIRGIKLYKYYGNALPMPAGSRIKLWGVRA